MKDLSKQCEFGDFCDSVIRDRRICGVWSNNLSEGLFCDPNLSLIKATDICKSSDLSKTQAQYINDPSEVQQEEIDFVQKQNRSKQSCYSFETIR